MMKRYILIATVLFLAVQLNAQSRSLVDGNATQATKNLYKNLEKLVNKGIMFGHQDDLAYGVEWKHEENRSDIKDVAGDYPAVFGWDIGKIEHRHKMNLDGIPFAKMRDYIKQVYDMGGVNTISWHIDNPATLGSAWDNSKAAASVLPGGENHELYKKWLKNGAKFLKSLKGSDGKVIPILFRPYHELNGGWFWWGKDSTSTEEYVALWKFTVNYLRDNQQVHNLIYVYNTNSFNSTAEYMRCYPGDNYADIMSFDNYQFSKPKGNEAEIKKSSAAFKQQIRSSLDILDSVSKEHNKIPAFAETGYETIPDSTWWTETLWDAVKDYRISYILVWRNHGWQEKEKKFHYYAPYNGHKSTQDFKSFFNLNQTLFNKDVRKENLYK